MVPSAYNALAAHRSWSLLLLRFLCDRELSLFSRMVRRPPVSSVTP
jgi:sphingolipid delta-4 desaturase